LAGDFLLLGATTLLGVYYLILFLDHRASRENLHIAVFSFLYCLSILPGPLVLLFPDQPGWLFGAAGTASAVCAGGTGLLILRFLFPQEAPLGRKFPILPVWGAAGLVCAALYAVALPVGSGLARAMTGLALVLVLVSLVRAWRLQRRHAGLYLGVFLVLFLLVSADFASSLVWPQSPLNVSPWGIGLLLTAFTVRQSAQFWKAHVTNQRLALSLEQVHQKLNQTHELYIRFVPFQFLEAFGKTSIADLRLGDQREQHQVVLVADIRSFTTLSESMSAVETFRFLNAYLGRVGPLIRAHEGFIVRYIGDAILAIFGSAPEKAVAAALEMQRSLAEWAVDRPFSVGIGLHCGPMTLGVLGEVERISGAVVSPVVPVAEKLESLTKAVGARILISEALWQSLKTTEGLQVRTVDFLSVPAGKMAVMELLDRQIDPMAEQKSSRLIDHEKALKVLRDQGPDEAGPLLDKLATGAPADPVYPWLRKQYGRTLPVAGAAS